jgi:hypothetical protein
MRFISNTTPSYMFFDDLELYAGEPKPTAIVTLEEMKARKIFGVYERRKWEPLAEGFVPYNNRAVIFSGMKLFRFWEL